MTAASLYNVLKAYADEKGFLLRLRSGAVYFAPKSRPNEETLFAETEKEAVAKING